MSTITIIYDTRLWSFWSRMPIECRLCTFYGLLGNDSDVLDCYYRARLSHAINSCDSCEPNALNKKYVNKWQFKPPTWNKRHSTYWLFYTPSDTERNKQIYQCKRESAIALIYLTIFYNHALDIASSWAENKLTQNHLNTKYCSTR